MHSAVTCCSGCLLSGALLLASLPGHADQCGSPSPGVRSGTAYYEPIQASHLGAGQIEALHSLMASIKGEWRGKGTILVCGAEQQRYPSRLELEVEGDLEQGMRFRKRVRNIRKGSIDIEGHTLSLAGDVVEFNSQAHIALSRLDTRMLRFTAKFKLRARGGNIVNRGIVHSLELNGDTLVYREREYTQGVLSWQGEWTLQRIL